MTTPVIIVGHKNPDNDSIASAVAYSYLKNALATRAAAAAGTEPEFEYIPARLGPCPAESAWVLEKNGFEQPRLISHIRLRVCDVMTPAPISVTHDASIEEAGRLLRTHGIRSVVVTNPDGTFRGLFTTRALSERLVASTDKFDEGGKAAVVADLEQMLDETVDSILSTDVLRTTPEAVLDSVVDDLINSALREAAVLDEKGMCVGILTRSDVADPAPRKVALVDHNEVRQAVDGIQDAEVVEIIDHHRIADVMTANPIQFMNLPWGSTATIITTEYKKHDVEITPAIAAVLLSAILTDTVILKSPTATDIDREQVEYLSKIVGCDPVEYGVQLFRERAGSEEVPVEKLCGADAKEFGVGDGTVLIAQYETVDLKSVLDREAEIREHLSGLVQAKGYEFALLMATDIIAEGSQFIVEGDTRIPNRAFDIECNPNGGNWMPGVLSRKKQVAAKILS